MAKKHKMTVAGLMAKADAAQRATELHKNQTMLAVPPKDTKEARKRIADEALGFHVKEPSATPIHFHPEVEKVRQEFTPSPKEGAAPAKEKKPAVQNERIVIITDSGSIVVRGNDLQIDLRSTP